MKLLETGQALFGQKISFWFAFIIATILGNVFPSPLIYFKSSSILSAISIKRVLKIAYSLKEGMAPSGLTNTWLKFWTVFDIPRALFTRTRWSSDNSGGTGTLLSSRASLP